MSAFNTEFLTPQDEAFHLGDATYQMDSSWFGFYVPERQLYVWCYHIVFHNLGIGSGGVFAWEGQVSNIAEMSYYKNYPLLKLGERRDRRDFTFPSGMHLKVIEDLQKYRIGYDDGDLVAFDLIYEGVLPAAANVHPVTNEPWHIDQLCRVTGDLKLKGETMTVDCYCIADHGWGSRDPRQAIDVGPWKSISPELLGATPVCYSFGAVSEDNCFFLFNPKFWHEADMPLHGYLVKEGEAGMIERADQVTERDPQGRLIGASYELTDVTGRVMEAKATAVSRVLAPNAGSVMFGEFCLAQWQIDGCSGWGDMQQGWPPEVWSAYQAALNG